ncbi:hypothetical protein [Sporisorium scitamineum]|uniref:Decapping enzyme n=1 Tax=Sporisorium scitamineum TaxID=49012 RepID=A0A0F7RUA6_9BASI|nr:hypothetical protein [Sporisorium scitamineum]
MTSIPEARSSFNLKVLRRHDSSIVEIVETASFVVLYNYNNGEWTKTGVEGPLFLFRRRLPPYNGFFLMNRNGVENFSADVTPDDDLEITPEFIIYRPEKNGDNEVYGIWVFEPNQRMAIGDKLLKLQQMVEAPSEEQVRQADKASSSTVPAVSGEKQAAPAAASQKNAKAEPEASAVKETSEAVPSAAPDNLGGTQINLDDLFGSSAPAPAHTEPEPTDTTSAPAHENSTDTSNGTSLLDSLFQKAVSVDTSTSTTSESKSTAVAAEPSDNHAQNLLALLGSSTSSSTPAPAAVATDSVPTQAKSPTDQPTSSTQDKVGAPKMSELIEQGICDRIGLGDDGKPLSRREFVTELLSMVHTNPEFVTELYESYLSRVS